MSYEHHDCVSHYSDSEVGQEDEDEEDEDGLFAEEGLASNKDEVEEEELMNDQEMLERKAK